MAEGATVTVVVFHKNGKRIGDRLLHVALAFLQITYGLEPHFLEIKDEEFSRELED